MTTVTTKNEPKSVILTCVKEGSRLRVRIISDGYKKGANCQFPRDIRKENQNYKVLSSSIKLAKGPRGKYFYRINKKDIEVLKENIKINIKIYQDEHNDECAICMDENKEMVFVPCGHFCTCKKCAKAIKNIHGSCPMCRSVIEDIVTIDMIG